MQAIETISVGDKLWQGHGLMDGRDHDDTATGYYATESEALDAVRAEWLLWLSPREMQRADVYARRYKILSLEDDGTVGSAVTCD